MKAKVIGNTRPSHHYKMGSSVDVLLVMEKSKYYPHSTAECVQDGLGQTLRLDDLEITEK